MQILFWIWLGIILKLPVVGICYLIYKVVNDTPEQILGDDDGGSGVRFEQGPRVRGPRDGRTPFKRPPRRGDKGHGADHDGAKAPAPEHAAKRG